MWRVAGKWQTSKVFSLKYMQALMKINKLSLFTEHSGNKKRNNVLPSYGNESMNLNSLILTNIQNSVYFKGQYLKPASIKLDLLKSNVD